MLRGDVDHFGLRLRRVHSIEEHVPLSVLYKQFFAGELEVICSMPEFWKKVTVIYSGGDDFAVYGAWDALIGLAREVQRLFHRFTEENLKDYPGAEGKTISMAIALAPETYHPLAAVYEEAGANLDLAKSSDRDCIYLLGRILEWKRLNDAAELKDTVTRLIHDFRMSRQFLYQLRSFYSFEDAHRSAAAHVALSAALQPRAQRHARPRVSEAAHTFDRRDHGTEDHGREAASGGPGRPGMGQIGDRGLTTCQKSNSNEIAKGSRPPREGRGPGGERGGDRGERGDRGDRRGGERGRPEGPPEIELEKLLTDSLYLDNQAHAIVIRMRDMDSGTKSQLRRLYSAVRRAVRAPENERQHEFVMLRARLAYTIARHGLRSLDQIEKLLLQVTRKNDERGYERFKDLFEAIVAYNE